ncbi:MAG: hypothetical protein GYA15_14980 [Leptolinea sp.]|nr:hypothetical protein [Leptolinea sp.]
MNRGLPLRDIIRSGSHLLTNTMKSWLTRKRVEAFLLFVFTILAYGLVIPKLGLFGDDWPHLWVYHMFGLDGLNQLVAWDRPFSAWVYAVIAPLAGEHIWAYHLYLLILRWVCAVIFYLLVIEILPDSHPLPFWTAAFFLLYPGFRQQPQPIEFILHFTALGLMLLSFWMMIQASKNYKPVWQYSIPGWICALSIFSIEYFIGLELLRPVLLWIVIRRDSPDNKSAVRRVIKNWIPYLVILGIYAWWRIFIFKFPTYKPTFLNQSGENPLTAIFGLGQILIEEIRASILGAWRQMVSLPLQENVGPGYGILVLLVAAGVFFWLRRQRKNAGQTSPFIPLLVGSIAILLAGVPFWITGIPVQLEFPWDRSMLPFMIGASLLISGGLLLLRPGLRNFFVAVIIALGIGMHYQNAMLYQKEWAKLGQFFWQLTWRAPALKPGAVVISDAIPLFYYGDNNLTPVLNWTYAPKNSSLNLPYNFFDMGERLGKNLPELKPGLPVEHGYRFIFFNSTSDALVPVYYREGNCLRIVDERIGQMDSIPRRLREASVFSHPEMFIDTSSQAMPPAFIPEPEHNWCYYYQKAELAVQYTDWQTIGTLFKESSQRQYKPTDQTEWLPFIEGLVHLNEFDQAVEISLAGLEQEGARQVICGLWNRLSADNPDVGKYIDKAGCR